MRYDKLGHPIVDNLDQVDQYIDPRNKKAEKEKINLDAVSEVNNGQLNIDHLSAANMMVEFIHSIPNMDHWIKDVMIMRIGRPALNGKKMSHMAIALELGMTVKEVKECEKAGVAIANAWLEKVTFIEGANGNPSIGGINDTLNKVQAMNN